jgi:periplasmic protein TonB
MTPMSGAALSPAPMGSRSGPPVPPPPPPTELFDQLVVSAPPRTRRGGYAMPASVIGHVLVIGALVAVPIFWATPPPEHPDFVRALLYNPPPPPPAPLPKGSALIDKAEPVKQVTPETNPRKPELEVEIPVEKPLEPEAKVPETEQAGSATGSDQGLAEGMEGGVEGGVVGGVPGGVLGGVVGGTGDGPVMDYDQPPRPIKLTRPTYPQEAFVKKIEGTVELEILIDANGRVVSARVVRSIPMLDAAAVQTVKEWVFSPAMKGGRPVATRAMAPVTFRIF